MGKKRNAKPIVIHIELDPSKIPNKAHFDAQRRFKAGVFADRKKRAKGGYRKHKKPYDGEQPD